jgi:hypothetical protein
LNMKTPRMLARPHRWYECSCNRVACQWCEGGLGHCTVCGAFEGQLLSSCPGERLTEEALEACYQGNVVDFIIIHEFHVYCRENGIPWPPDWAARTMRQARGTP